MGRTWSAVRAAPVLALLTLAVPALAVPTLAVPAQAAAAPSVAPPAAVPDGPVSISADPQYSVTFAARVCPDYTDIMANRARNDIQESLKDLGKDTVYTAGQPIDPTIEAANDPACSPLDGAVFSVGDGYTKPGPADYSIVTVSDPASAATTAPTQAGVDLLDDQGRPTGKTIDGATTLTLNDTQLALAGRDDSLWVQGGTRSAPLPAKGSAGDSYAFGALRCAIDNLNGDNVEWIGYPSGTQAPVRHVFCFAYYVDVAPPQGTITVVKQLAEGSGAIDQRFTFASNATYNPSGTFDLDVTGGAPAKQEFVRATSESFGQPYVFSEQLADLNKAGWTLESLTCTGGARTTTDPATGTATVDLQAGENVVCTWVDRPPSDPGLHIRKVTTGAVGTFPIAVRGPGVEYDLTATTTSPGQPVSVPGLPDSVPPGQYTITETLPAATGGSWTADQAYCTRSVVPTASGRTGDAVTAMIQVDLVVGGSADCTFVNVFHPAGRVVLRLVTDNGTATGGFVVEPTPVQPEGPGVASSESRFKQTATTTAPATPATAVPDTPADATDALPLQRYSADSQPPITTRAGTWEFVSFTCTADSPTPVELGPGTLGLTLTPGQPNADCTARYRLAPPSTLTLTKTVGGDAAARTGPVTVSVTCDNGNLGRVVGPPGEPGPFELPAPGPLLFLQAATCRLGELSSGAADGARVAVRAELTGPGGPVTVPVPGTFTIAQPTGTTAAAYALEVADVYTAAPTPPGPPTPPTPPPPPTPTPPTGPAAPGIAALPVTGARPVPILELAAGLLAVGAALALSARRPRAARQRPGAGPVAGPGDSGRERAW